MSKESTRDVPNILTHFNEAKLQFVTEKVNFAQRLWSGLKYHFKHNSI